MTVTVDSTGVRISDFSTLLDEIVKGVSTALELTSSQKDRVLGSVQSVLGNLSRIDAERELAMSQALVEVYQTLTLETSGANLDRLVKLLGVERRGAIQSRITGTASGTGTPGIPEGTRIRYNPDNTFWTARAGHSVGDADVEFVSESTEGVTVAVSPDTGHDDWTIIDQVSGFSGFSATSQTVTGAPIESDNGLRNRASIEVFQRAQGSERSIEANVLATTDPKPTYARVSSNRSPTTDLNGIPGHAINLVVDGGDDDKIAEAYYRARPAGVQTYADPANLVSRTVTDSQTGTAISIEFNRVTAVPIHVSVALTLSTVETVTPGVEDLIQALIVEQAALAFGIDDDVEPFVLETVIGEQGYAGLVNAVVTLSTDGITFVGGPIAISIRQRPTFALARTTVS